MPALPDLEKFDLQSAVKVEHSQAVGVNQGARFPRVRVESGCFARSERKAVMRAVPEERGRRTQGQQYPK